MKCVAIIILAAGLITSMQVYAAHEEQELVENIRSYCRYISEKNNAKRILLHAPDALFRVDNGDVYNKLQTVVVAGLSKDLMDLRKAKIIKQLIHDECTYYELNQEAKIQIRYLIASIEVQTLHFKLQQIHQAKEKLNVLLQRIKEQIKRHNETLSTYYAIDSSLKRLQDTERQIDIDLAGRHIPYVPYTNLSQLLKKLSIAEHQRRATMNQLQKQDNWSLQLQAGAQQNVSYSQNQTVQPYFSFLFKYNLGAQWSNHVVDNSLESFTHWQNNQVLGVQKRLSHLIASLKAIKSAEEERLMFLGSQNKKYSDWIENVSNIQATEALRFKQQVEVDAVFTDIEMRCAKHSIEVLNSIT